MTSNGDTTVAALRILRGSAAHLISAGRASRAHHRWRSARQASMKIPGSRSVDADSQFVDKARTSSTLIASSDKYGHTKANAFETSFRRIDCRRHLRARINSCDRGRQCKTNSSGETSYDRVERPPAGSLDPETCLSGLSFRKYSLAVVLAYPSDFLANSRRCGEGSSIHGSIEVERLYRDSTAGLHVGHR